MAKQRPAPARAQAGQVGGARAPDDGAELNNLLARFHAVWTLEGLGALDAAMVRSLLADPIRRTVGLRASETLYKAGDRSLQADYTNLMKDTDADVVIQAMLTLNVVKAPGAIATIRPVVQASTSRGVKEIGGQLVARNGALAGGGGGGGGRGGPAVAPEVAASLERGGAIYNELCFSCHGEDGRGTPLAGAEVGATRAPSLESAARVSAHRDHLIKVLLHGLTGPVDGKTYSEVMIPMGLRFQRSMDRGRGHLCAGQLQQQRTGRDAGRRRARARSDDGPSHELDVA